MLQCLSSCVSMDMGFILYNSSNYTNNIPRIAYYYGGGVGETLLYEPATNRIGKIDAADIYSLRISLNLLQESVNLSFVLSQTANAGLAIYGILGKVVKVVLNAQKLNSVGYNYFFIRTRRVSL